MNNSLVQVPVPLLLDPELTASAKVVGIALRLAPAAGPAQLEAMTGLARATVLSGVRQRKRHHDGPRVTVPCALLAERSVGAQAKVLYGLLQTVPGFRGQRGEFTYATICFQTQLSRNTLKLAIADLERAGWIQLTQANRLRPISFKLGNPLLRRSLFEAIVAERRLKRGKHGGEALMQEYLSLLIDSDDFTENARPGFLINPLTGERLEFDRFYPPSLAFEFHGSQHYGETERVSQDEAEEQRFRDIIKAGLCFYRGIQLVLIHQEDLSLEGMIKRIPPGIPCRSLAGREPLTELLEGASMRYQAGVRKPRSSGQR